MFQKISKHRLFDGNFGTSKLQTHASNFKYILKMTVFRACIDLHAGKVKQIVGGSLKDIQPETLVTNFESDKPPSYYANLYKENHVEGSHVIQLGPGNKEAAVEALQTWNDHLQIGGGIHLDNACFWIDEARASSVIVTGFLFPDGKFDEDRLRKLSELLGSKKKLVVDLSCRKKDSRWVVAMNKWQTLTDMHVNAESIEVVETYCGELLVHAADVEGLCQGIDENLVKNLSAWCHVPVTYAGGAKSIEDFHLVNELSKGSVDITFGSSLDIFGGTQVKFSDLVELNKHSKTNSL